MDSRPEIDERLVRAALRGQAPSLDGVSAADLGTAGWRSLLLLETLLPADSSWQKRVHSIRRSNFYSTSIASALAVTLCERLADFSPMVFGDLALAAAHCQRAGDRQVGYLAIHVGKDTDRDQLAAVLSSLPQAGPVDAGRLLVRTRVNGMTVGLYRSWPLLMASPSARLDATSTAVETAAGTFPVVCELIESLRILSSGQQDGQDPSWLLDLASISPSDQTFASIAALASRLDRRTAVRASWAQAHRFGVAPPPPAMSDPPAAGLSQRLALSPDRVRRALGFRLLRLRSRHE